MEKQAYSIPEFCTAFSIGRSKLYTEIRAGRLQVVKIGTRTIISAEIGRDWLRRMAAEQASCREVA